MNDFTKEELEYLVSCPSVNCRRDIICKIQSMLDNYEKYDAKAIAKAHLQEAESLIHHAMCLLRMVNE